MRFHVPSFLLGFGAAAVLIGARSALRPAFVEITALGVHLGRLGRAVISRQREHWEDLFAEVEEAARRRARGRTSSHEAPRPAETH